MVNPKFSAALDILVKAKSDISELLNDADTGSVSIAITSNLDKAISRLSFMTGSNISAASADPFPPVTNFMGEDLEVKTPEPVVIDPTEEERRKFLEKVDNIINSLLSETLTPGQVVVNSPLPEDELVIRGAAKRAGLEDFDTAEISTAFVDRIKAALLDQRAAAEEQAKIDAELASVNTMDVTVTEEILKDNPELVEQGVEVGEKLIVGQTEADDAALAAEEQAKSKKGKGK